MKLLVKLLYWFAAMFVIAVGVRWWAPAWIDARYAAAVSARPQFAFDSCSKGWAHRGLVDESAGIRENTVASVQNAFERGAIGVEVDILFDAESGRFVVSHDRPYQRDGQGEFLELKALLSRAPEAGLYWLDAKDLRSLSPWVASEAVARLAELVQSLNLQDRVFVESRNALYLSWLAEKGIHTSLMISPNERKYSPAVFKANLYLAKIAYTWGPFSAFSMNDYRYTSGVAAMLGQDVPVLVSTVNDREAFTGFAKSPGIAVVLTDNAYFAYGCQQ